MKGAALAGAGPFLKYKGGRFSNIRDKFLKYQE